MFERYTARFHLRAVAGQGALSGVFIFNEFVLLRELGGSRWHVLALMLAPALGQLSAVAWNPAAPGRLLGRRPFRALGIGVHAVLLVLLIPACREGAVFVCIVATCLVAQALLIPLQNVILSRNYSEVRRSRRFSRAVSIQALLIIAVSVPVGWLLDLHRELWPALYAFAAVTAAFAFSQWGRVRRRRAAPPPPDLVRFPSAWAALWGDKRFLAFEACFMIYGIGFLALQPVLPIFLVEELGVDYADVGLARGALFWLSIIVVAPLSGRLGDRIGVLRLGAIGFLLLTLLPLMLVLFPDVYGMFAAYALFGAAMAFVNVSWNLGPIALARGRDPLPYLNAHLGLVGVRALIGMTGGALLHEAAGSRTVFLLVIGLEVIAAAAMLATARASGRRWRVPGAVDVAVPRPPR